MLTRNRLPYFHQQYIAHTGYKAPVSDNAFYVTRLTAYQIQAFEAASDVVLISTRALKHMYDKRTAREYDLIITNLNIIMREPDVIVTNPNITVHLVLLKSLRTKTTFVP